MGSDPFAGPAEPPAGATENGRTRPARPAETVPLETVLREEQLDVARDSVEAGRVRVRKTVVSEPVSRHETASSEEASVQRVAALDGDSGQVETLPDGSISIPLFEERLVVEKRLVVRERIVVRKVVTVEDRVVTADLRRERLDIDPDGAVAERVLDTRPAGP